VSYLLKGFAKYKTKIAKYKTKIAVRQKKDLLITRRKLLNTRPKPLAEKNEYTTIAKNTTSFAQYIRQP